MEVAAWLGSAGTGERKDLTSEVHLTERGRENVTSLEGVNRKGKHISTDTPSTHGPDGLVRKASSCGEGRPVGLGGPKAKWAGKASWAGSNK
jgi:hypothetical protein